MLRYELLLLRCAANVLDNGVGKYEIEVLVRER
jgi:hypothetical protein